MPIEPFDGYLRFEFDLAFLSEIGAVNRRLTLGFFAATAMLEDPAR